MIQNVWLKCTIASFVVLPLYLDFWSGVVQGWARRVITGPMELQRGGVRGGVRGGHNWSWPKACGGRGVLGWVGVI